MSRETMSQDPQGRESLERLLKTARFDVVDRFGDFPMGRFLLIARADIRSSSWPDHHLSAEGCIGSWLAAASAALSWSWPNSPSPEASRP
jgi:hypothetical protein